MLAALLVMVCTSAAAGIGSAVCFVRRRAPWGVALGGACLGSLALGILAATRSDPPSLLPLWGWLVGLCLGAVPGAAWGLASASRDGGPGASSPRRSPRPGR